MKETTDITIGQLMDALKTNNFSDKPTTDFEKKCRAREEGIKQYIDIIGVMIHQHIEKPEFSGGKISFWKDEKIKSCIKNLADYTGELVKELDKEKIESYCRQLTPFNFFRSPFDPDFTLLMLNSYYGTIVTDIYWISEITIHEAMQISGGKLNISELGKRTPSKIAEIQSFLKKHKKRLKEYESHFGTIEEAFNCYKSKYLKAFNLLLLTSIEGLTRNLGLYLVTKQGLVVDPYSEMYNSLDGFLRKIPWKADLKRTRTSLSLLTSNYDRINYNDPFTKLPDPMEQISITLKTRLDFLRRRFKENRDLILHGQETEYDKPYYGFVNAAALYEVLETIIECQDIYEK
jgi:hypothetical protein